ncbi:hypothetical protein OG562_12685 [Streptomyces sp. NBC_01275]|uniref:effector-associated constant component EACC1 n=1 Tax=Streptomyces sp. NBC_01275 TaxID=2903807 RepID=UPI00224F633B|nr:hypothetical protein [Streptomyces sp. NBC_01275]MCX4761816.1 hypothetical protein [Streptomyces sp. NBC_01275]
MRWEIRAVVENGTAEVVDFYRWLRSDEGRPEALTLESRAQADADGLMGPLEVVSLALTHAEAVANLVMLYANWRLTPGPRPTAAFTFRRAADGLSVTVDGASDEDVRRLMAVLSTPLPSPPTVPAPPSAPLP